MEKAMQPYDYPYRVVRPNQRPSIWLPVAALLVLLLLLIPSALFVYHYWPHSGSGLDPSAKPREVAERGPLYKNEADLAALYDKTLPSVVHVNNLSEQVDRFSLNVQEVPRGSGSGFVWDKQGHIVTNYHVVEGASAVQVVLSDKSSYKATNVFVYPEKDLAVLTIDAPASKLIPIPIGTSHDLKVGQSAIVIGNPFGLDGSMTNGIVSALGREIESPAKRQIQGVIQTSAPINPGNSGGPLLDSDGRLIGVTTAILSPSGTFAGIGFAIPVDEVNRVVPQLIAKGKIDRPRLGVELAEGSQVGREGALVLNVVPNSPAARGGLRPTRRTNTGKLSLGDIIVAVDKDKVQSVNDLYEALERHKAGDEVALKVVRDGEETEVKATLAGGS
jgi:S1-C subfamily serine protease